MTIPPAVTTRRGRSTRSPTDRGWAAADDLALLADYVAGDESAFDTLLERHQSRVYGICYGYFRDHRDAEDATQETFLALARHAADFRGDAKLATWLHRVAINVCHDIARYRARRPLPSQHETPDLPDAFDHVALRETEVDLEAALAQLDDPSRCALVLVAIEDRPYAEAAEIAGVSVPALKSRIHRARARLSDILQEAA